MPGLGRFPALAQNARTISKGYGTDPDLTKDHKPGDIWPLLMDATQKATTMALADIMLPADDLGPSASSLRVHDYIDEWISAPYPHQQSDQTIVLKGLNWLDQQSRLRFKKSYGEIEPAAQQALCREICGATPAPKDFPAAVGFFRRFRSIAMGAYYGTTAGWKAIGYIGNVPSLEFSGPDETVLKKLGLEQTVR